MHKKFRSIMAGVVSLAMVGAMSLVGCASNSTANNNATAANNTASANTTSSNTADQVKLQIFAANSLSKAMEEVQTLYTSSHPNVTFADTQYKSSGELNELLKAGSYADLLISASKGSMDTAADAGYVDTSTRKDMFKNDLVMVASENSSLTNVTLADIATGAYKIAVGDDSVPAGNYANQSLSTVGCFNDPDGKTGAESAGKANGTDAYAGTPIAGKVVTDTSVGNVCKHAQSGDVDVAFVYTSDVYRFGGVKIVGTVPADTHKKILYPGAVTSQSKNAQATSEFLNWCLTDAEAAKVWQKWGFELV